MPNQTCSNPLSRVNINSTEFDSVKRKTDKTVAVVVTICTGSSYDHLFTSVPQVSPEGIVAVYRMDQLFTDILMHKLYDTPLDTSNSNSVTTNEETNVVLEESLKNLKELEPSSIVFNWECCSGCSESGFTSSSTIQFIHHLLESGYMVMCSDFSVKAIIRTWDDELLGPNPFSIVGSVSGNFEIKFEPNQLKDCPSAQLQKLGELCDEGKANLHAMGGTVQFNANPSIANDTARYRFSLLTLCTAANGVPITNYKDLTIGDDIGIVGHASLSYPSGGILLLSAGHWIELSNIKTSEESVMRAAEGMYGATYAKEWKTNLASAPVAERASILNKYSAQMIQNCTPAQYSNFS